MTPRLTSYAAFNQFTPALPQFYWDVYSAEQRIKHICYELCKLSEYSNYLSRQINKLGKDIEEEVNEIREEVAQKQREFYDEIMHIISELQIGSLQWNVQRGEYTTSVDAQRDMFNDVTVHSYNLEELDSIFDELGMDVNGLANCGLNVKGFAVMNHMLKHPDKITPEYTPDTPHEGTFTVNDLLNASLDSEGFVKVN